MGDVAIVKNAPVVKGQAKTRQDVSRQKEQKRETYLNDFYSSILGGIFTQGSTTPRIGADFSQIPVRPKMRTTPGIQRCSKDGITGSCRECSKKAESDNAEIAINDEMALQQSAPEQQPAEQSPVEQTPAEQSPVEETSPASPETTEVSPEAQVSREQSTSALIADDSATELSEGQMKKTEFMQQLRSEICGAIEPILATVGQTTDGCPYLNYWLDLYQEKDASEIERTVKRYAPGSSSARTAQDYISLIVQRAIRSAETWVKTGKLSGIPEGVPTTIPGQTASAGGEGESTQRTAVQAKAREGGAKKVDDPHAIQTELGNGEPLEGTVRSHMESAFGMDFSHVRAHTDANANSLSNRVNARAFTVGNHVAFGTGEYKPGTMLGDALIAHELAHTIQQSAAGASVDKMEVGTAGYNQLESDADQSAMGVVSSLWSEAKEGLKGMAQRTLPMLRSGLKIQRCNKETCSEGKKSVSVDLVKFRGSSRTPSSDLAYANTIYNKCCINFTIGQDKTVPDALSDKWLVGDKDANFSGITCGFAPAEEVSMYDGATKEYNLSSRMRAFYVETFSGYAAGGFSRPPYCASGNASSYVNHIVLQNNAPQSGLAHELGHILLNSGDHPSEPNNLMGPGGGSVINDTQCKTMYNNA